MKDTQAECTKLAIRSSYLPVLGELRGICPQSRLMCRCERGAPSAPRAQVDKELIPGREVCIPHA